LPGSPETHLARTPAARSLEIEWVSTARCRSSTIRDLWSEFLCLDRSRFPVVSKSWDGSGNSEGTETFGSTEGFVLMPPQLMANEMPAKKLPDTFERAVAFHGEIEIALNCLICLKAQNLRFGLIIDKSRFDEFQLRRCFHN
jgi:hypothetical protein